MAEDLTSYTEVDPNSHISATASRATGANVGRDESCYLYYDKGVDYFAALCIDFDICVSTFPVNGMLGVFGISNTLNDFGVFGNDDIKVMFYNRADYGNGLYFSSAAVSDRMQITKDVIYYCTLERTSGSATVNLKVYSDALRTTLLDTLTFDLATASTKHRYIFSIASNRAGSTAYACSGYVENIVINEVAAGSLVSQNRSRRFNPLLVR